MAAWHRSTPTSSRPFAASERRSASSSSLRCASTSPAGTLHPTRRRGWSTTIRRPSRSRRPPVDDPEPLPGVRRQNLEHGRPPRMLLGRVALQVPAPEHLLRARRTRPLQVGLARIIGGQQLAAEAPGGLAARAHQQPQAGLDVEKRPVRGPAERTSRPHSAALPSELTFDQARAAGSVEQCLDLASHRPRRHRPQQRPGPRRPAEGSRGEAASLPLACQQLALVSRPRRRTPPA
jgi:hypothetical protein